MSAGPETTSARQHETAQAEPGPGPGHVPVLLDEAIALLAPRPGGRFVDATFGGGGHTAAILAASAPDGVVLALDADAAAIVRAQAQAATLDDPSRLRPVHTNFLHLAAVTRDAGLAPVDGVLMDLGLSSFQLDTAGRGFSFSQEGPLDMRLDAAAPAGDQPFDRGAAQFVNQLTAEELATMLWQFGEERESRRIARAIVRAREDGPISSTTQLAAIVERAVGGRRGRPTHPATRTFQALRIATNAELDVLEPALRGAVNVLAPGGRLVVIAFHSLEDRIVKRFIERESATCICPPQAPVCTCDQVPRLRKLTRRAVRPGPAEVATNPRSRSAVLRAAERVSSPAAAGVGDDAETGDGDRG